MGSPSSAAQPHTPSSSLPQTGGLSENQKQNRPARIRGKEKDSAPPWEPKRKGKHHGGFPGWAAGVVFGTRCYHAGRNGAGGTHCPFRQMLPILSSAFPLFWGGVFPSPPPPPAAMTPSMHGLLECNLTPPTPPSWGERRHQHLQQHLAQAQRRGRKEGFHPLQTTSSPFPSQERVAGLQLSLTSHAGDRQGGKPSAQLLRTSKQNPAWFLETAQKRGR